MKKQLLFILMVLLPFITSAQEKKWITYSDGTHANFLNNVGSVYDIAYHYTPEEIQTMGFTSISSVQVYGIAQGPPTGVLPAIMIWEEDVLKVTESYEHVVNDWATITFDTPITVDPTKNLYIAVRYLTMNEGYAYSSCDGTLDHPGKGNIYRRVTDGVAGNWEESFPGMGDWNIKVEVEFPTPSETFISYSDGTHGSFLNNVGAIYDIANLYTPKDIQTIGFTSISSVQVYGIAQGPPNGVLPAVMIWEEDVLKVTESYNHVVNGWATITFDTPITVDPTKNLYVAVRYLTMNEGYAYSSCDGTLDHPGKGNIYRRVTDGVAGNWEESFPGMGDWNIKVGVQIPFVQPEYTVTFSNLYQITTPPTPPSLCLDAQISLGGKTNLPGNYEFSAPSGEYRYVVSKEGFRSVVGTVVVEAKDVEVNMIADMLFLGADPYYEISFDIKDDQNNPIEDAQITFNEKIWGVGVYSADNIQPGVYNYSISRFGYEVHEGHLAVIGDEVLEVELVKQPTYKVNFNVNKFNVLDPDNGTPITDAVISMGFIINEAGDYEFNLPPGKHPYIISTNQALGNESGFIEVIDQDVNYTALLMPTNNPKYWATLWIQNKQGAQLVTKAKITFDETTLPSGEYNIQREAGIYEYTVECDGYYSYSDKFILVEDEMKYVVLEEIPEYEISFNLMTSGENEQAISDAIISLDYNKNEVGDYKFKTIPGSYTYIISRDGYKSIVGNIEVINKNIIVETLFMEQGEAGNYNLTFDVKNNLNQQVNDAVITLNETSYNAGDYLIENLIADVYAYTVTRAGYEDYTGKIILTSSETIEVNLGTPPLFEVTFNVRDDNDAIIEDVVITFNDEVLEGNSIDAIPGTYSYSISKTGYQTKTGSITLTDKDEEVNIILSLITYTVTFDVKDVEGEIVENVGIVFNNTPLNVGNTSIDVTPGTYSYTISKAEYKTVEGNITVTDKNEIVFITLEKSDVGIDVTNFAKSNIYPNPFTSHIVIQDPERKYEYVTITDILGKTVISLKLDETERIIVTEHLNKGAYVVILSNRKNNQEVYKLIKK